MINKFGYRRLNGLRSSDIQTGNRSILCKSLRSERKYSADAGVF